jgi:hypothetical protein
MNLSLQDVAVDPKAKLAKSRLPTSGAVSSVGRASRLHREGQRFEPVTAHQFQASAADTGLFCLSSLSALAKLYLRARGRNVRGSDSQGVSE